MYGLYSYSENPYSTSPSNLYGRDVVETFSVLDSSDVATSYAVARVEPITSADTIIGGYFYPVTRVEAFTSSDASTVATTYAVSVTENFNPISVQVVGVAYQITQVEPITLANAQLGGGWFVINANQTPNWTIINNGQ
jgi:hypothetical protein